MRSQQRTRGQRLKALRQAHGLTQAQLAQTCDVNPSFISILEHDVNTPSRELLFRLADALATSVDYLEAGKESEEDRAREARLSVWPQAVYTISNDIIVPRFAELVGRIPPAGPVRVAIERAWSSKHFCEYMDWVGSESGTALGRKIAQSADLDTLVQVATEPFVPPAALWIDYAHPQKRDRRVLPTVDSRGRHAHGYNAHNPSFSIESAPAEGACYDFELVATAHFYSELRLGIGRCDENDFWKRPFLSAFVKAAMPHVFWSAAQTWTDRRLAGWLRYLGMSADLYGPLTRLARQYEDPIQFTGAAFRLWREGDPGDADVFLGTFCDLYGNSPTYATRFGTPPLGGGPVVDDGKTIEPGTWPVRERRRTRASLADRLLFDAVLQVGDSTSRAKLSAFLRKIAPPHEFWREDVLRIIKSDKKEHRKQPPAAEYPETLP